MKGIEISNQIIQKKSPFKYKKSERGFSGAWSISLQGTTLYWVLRVLIEYSQFLKKKDTTLDKEL